MSFEPISRTLLSSEDNMQPEVKKNNTATDQKVLHLFANFIRAYVPAPVIFLTTVLLLVTKIAVKSPFCVVDLCFLIAAKCISTWLNLVEPEANSNSCAVYKEILDFCSWSSEWTLSGVDKNLWITGFVATRFFQSLVVKSDGRKALAFSTTLWHDADANAFLKELTDEGPWSSKWAITARNLLGFSHQDDIIPDYPPIRRADLNSEDSFDKTLSDYLLEANNHPEIVT